MKCKCGNEATEVEKYPLIPFKIWHCDKCDIDFYYRGDNTRVVIS